MRKGTKIIAMVLVVLFAVLSLCACDALLNTTKDDTKKTEKINFDQAVKNYENETVKRTDISVILNGTVFVNKDAALLKLFNAKDQYSIGSTINIVRTQEKNKLYLTSDLTASNTDNEVGTLVSLINSETAYLQHYLSGQIELGAELGIQNGTYNLKAHFNDKEAKKAESIWLVANDSSLSAWLNNNSQLEITENKLNSYLMKTIFSQLDKESVFWGKDDATKYVDKNGHASYDISLKEAKGIVSAFLSSGLLDIIGVTDKSGTIERYKDFFSDINNWFTVEAEHVNADISNNLPQKITTGFTIDLNIKAEKIRQLIKKLQDDEIIDESTATISTSLINAIALCLRGTNKQENTIGLKLHVDFEEVFSYDSAKCNLHDDAHRDFFIGPDEDVEGRMNLADYVAGIISNVDEYLEKVLATLKEHYADNIDEIRERIIQKKNEIAEADGQVTVAKLRAAIESILEDYTPTDDAQNGAKTSLKETIRNWLIGG